MHNNENKAFHDKKGRELAEKMSVTQLSSQLRHSSKALPKLGIKQYNWWNEALHGVARAGIATVFPQALAMASTFDENTLYNVASIISTEARAKFNFSQSIGDYGIYKGLTMWSPNINIYRDPRWGRGHETYGEDPYLTGILGVAFIKGLQGNDEKYLKASACAKHFAVHSGPEAERHTFNAVVSKKDLFETYLPAFEKAVTDGKVSGVMGAYNRVNGEACCASDTLIKKILRTGWGFDGYFVSDCSALHDIVYKHRLTSNPIKGAAMALNAGCDLECGTLYNLLPFAAAAGYVDKSTLINSVSRLMSIRSALGMFDGNCPYNTIDIKENATKENEEYAVTVAEKSVVMLENNGILPLKKNKQKIFITGYNAENERAYLGNYYGEPTSYVKIFEAVKQFNENTRHSQGVHLFSKKQAPNQDEALTIASESDVIIMCTGLDESVEGEESGNMKSGGGGAVGKQGDRITLELPLVQQQYLDALIALDKKVIILNFSGGCMDFRKFKNRVDAIIQCWYPGAKGGLAIARILFGEVSPSGKLPVTFYNSVKDLPDFEDYAMKNRTYRYFRGDVQYPFGYGLSYADFKLESITFDEENKDLCATVKNNSGFSSDEVLQLYVSYPKVNYQNPIKSLVAVKRVYIKKGQSKSVNFSLSEKDFYSVDNDGNKVYLKGEYRIFVTDGDKISGDEIIFNNESETKIIEKCLL